MIDIPAVLRFFGREELRSTPSAPADTLLEVATDQQEEGREEGPRQDLLQAEEEEEQSSSVVEVRSQRRTENSIPSNRLCYTMDNICIHVALMLVRNGVGCNSRTGETWWQFPISA